MAKTTITGKSSRRSVLQVAEDIIRQLCDRSVVDWLSNGEDAVHGSLCKLELNRKGLRLTLDNGRTVTWKVGANASHHVMRVMGQRFGWTWARTGSLELAN